MRLVKKVVPQIVKARTKKELDHKIFTNYVPTISSSGNYWKNMFNGKKLAVNFEKHKRKTAPFPMNTRGKKRKIVKETQWVAYVYEFDADFPIIIKQKSRNFDYEYR